jgi:transposase
MLSSGPRASRPDGTVVERVLRNGKRMYVHEFKLSLVRRCRQPGVSVSAVALEHGINANLLRKWIDKHAGEVGAREGQTLLPVEVVSTDVSASASSAPSGRVGAALGTIEIELAGARVRLRGAVDEASVRSVLAALRATGA